MATIGNTYLNLIDTYAGAEGDVLEVLRQNNPVLLDAVAVEANMGPIHRHSIRTGYGSGTWGRLYKGIPMSKGSYQQVDDTTGFLEARSAVDKRLLALAGDKVNQLRLNEAEGILQGMSHEMATGVFYHDTATTPEKFKGLSARYDTIGGGGAGNQIVDGGGSGSDNTSIWFITWGANATHLIYPSGTKAGVDREDKGEQRVTDSNSDPYYVLEELFTWHIGLAVKDWRYNARIANIDVSDVAAGTVDVYDLLAQGYYKLQSRARRNVGNGVGGSGNAEPMTQAIYMNRDMLAHLDKVGRNAGASDNFIRLTPKQIEGEEVLTYRGIPIREEDAILNTEAAIS